MIRIETFVSTDPEIAGSPRGYLATLQVLEQDPKTQKWVSCASMNFRGASEKQVRDYAEQWLAAEKERQLKIAGNRNATSERMSRRHAGSAEARLAWAEEAGRG